MKHAILIVLLFGCVGCTASRPASDTDLKARSTVLTHRFILIDTHVDTPYRLREETDDISIRSSGNFDYVKAREGGLNAPFMSIYIPSSYEQDGGAKLLADTLIAMVESWSREHPEKFEVATSVADVRRISASSKIALAMGMENGSPIEHDLSNISYFFRKGIRYITLTHAKDNHLSDSSYDTTGTWHGLSPFGEEVVREMNRVGIMVDVSHITDDAFWDVLRVSKSPVIASHSSCRHFTPGWQRNMSDDMIRALAKNGGVIMINFGSSFISNTYRLLDSAADASIRRYVDEHHLQPGDSLVRKFSDSYHKDHPVAYADVSQVADHIDHVVKLVGIDHVGIGSDFDGVGDSLPTGLKDASQYPNLISELLRRGYSEEDIEKICGTNLLRVWSRVEALSNH